MTANNATPPVGQERIEAEPNQAEKHAAELVLEEYDINPAVPVVELATVADDLDQLLNLCREFEETLERTTATVSVQVPDEARELAEERVDLLEKYGLVDEERRETLVEDFTHQAIRLKFPDE